MRKLHFDIDELAKKFAEENTAWVRKYTDYANTMQMVKEVIKVKNGKVFNRNVTKLFKTDIDGVYVQADGDAYGTYLKLDYTYKSWFGKYDTLMMFKVESLILGERINADEVCSELDKNITSAQESAHSYQSNIDNFRKNAEKFYKIIIPLHEFCEVDLKGGDSDTNWTFTEFIHNNVDMSLVAKLMFRA